MKAFKIPLQIFPITVVCYIGDKGNMRKHCNSILPKSCIDYLINNDTLKYDGCTYNFGDEHIVMWLEKLPRSTMQIGLLAHEVDHAVGYVMSAISADRNKECECSAYLFQYIMEAVLEKK
jgi:hypothetical protein